MRSRTRLAAQTLPTRRPVFTMSGVSSMPAVQVANAAGANQQIIVALHQDYWPLSQYTPYASSTPARRDVPCGFIGIPDQAAAGQVDFGTPDQSSRSRKLLRRNKSAAKAAVKKAIRAWDEHGGTRAAQPLSAEPAPNADDAIIIKKEK